jgi:hypothetical protein
MFKQLFLSALIGFFFASGLAVFATAVDVDG